MTIFNPKTVDDIARSFPTYEIIRIDGRPKYAPLKAIFKELNKLSVSIKSTRNVGHLYLTTTDAEYAKATGQLKYHPIVPTPTLQIKEVKPTAAQIELAKSCYDEENRVYNLQSLTDSALKNLLTAAVKPVYFLGHNKEGTTTLQLISFLKARYWSILDKEVTANDVQFKENWDMDTSIEDF